MKITKTLPREVKAKIDVFIRELSSELELTHLKLGSYDIVLMLAMAHLEGYIASNVVYNECRSVPLSGLFVSTVEVLDERDFADLLTACTEAAMKYDDLQIITMISEYIPDGKFDHNAFSYHLGEWLTERHMESYEDIYDDVAPYVRRLMSSYDRSELVTLSLDPAAGRLTLVI